MSRDRLAANLKGRLSPDEVREHIESNDTRIIDTNISGARCVRRAAATYARLKSSSNKATTLP